MRFENNIAFNNGFGGVVYHKTDRGELVNNLVFMNGAYPGQSNYTGMTLNTAKDVYISNNIIWARDNNDYALKDNGGAQDVVTTHNYVVGQSQFGTVEDNTIVPFDQAPALVNVFTNVVDLAAIVPNPHAVTGPSSAAEINARIEGFSLDFYCCLRQRYSWTSAPPKEHRPPITFSAFDQEGLVLTLVRMSSAESTVSRYFNTTLN